MNTIYLLREGDISSTTILGGNVDVDKFTPSIKIYQDTILEPKLGKVLYNKICQDFDNGTLSGIYLELYQDYLHPMVVNGSTEIYLSTGAYTVSNSGITKQSTNNGETLNRDELGFLSEQYHRYHRNYERMLDSFLKANGSDIPEYVDNSCGNKSNLHIGGWILSKGKSCSSSNQQPNPPVPPEPIIHNELRGLQGGDAELREYYHLTSKELEKLQEITPIEGVQVDNIIYQPNQNGVIIIPGQGSGELSLNPNFEFEIASTIEEGGLKVVNINQETNEALIEFAYVDRLGLDTKDFLLNFGRGSMVQYRDIYGNTAVFIVNTVFDDVDNNVITIEGNTYVRSNPASFNTSDYTGGLASLRFNPVGASVKDIKVNGGASYPVDVDGGVNLTDIVQSLTVNGSNYSPDSNGNVTFNVDPQYFTLTYEEARDLKESEQLIPRAYYTITDADPNLFDGKVEVQLIAEDEKTFGNDGVGKFKNPNRDNVPHLYEVIGMEVTDLTPNKMLTVPENVYYNGVTLVVGSPSVVLWVDGDLTSIDEFKYYQFIGDDTNEITIDVENLETPNLIGVKVIYGNLVYEYIGDGTTTGIFGEWNSIIKLDENYWAVVDYNIDDYVQTYDKVKYNFDSQLITNRVDNLGNNVTSSEGAMGFDNPIENFKWGDIMVMSNNVNSTAIISNTPKYSQFLRNDLNSYFRVLALNHIDTSFMTVVISCKMTNSLVSIFGDRISLGLTVDSSTVFLGTYLSSIYGEINNTQIYDSLLISNSIDLPVKFDQISFINVFAERQIFPELERVSMRNVVFNGYTSFTYDSYSDKVFENFIDHYSLNPLMNNDFGSVNIGNQLSTFSEPLIDTNVVNKKYVDDLVKSRNGVLMFVEDFIGGNTNLLGIAISGGTSADNSTTLNSYQHRGVKQLQRSTTVANSGYSYRTNLYSGILAVGAETNYVFRTANSLADIVILAGFMNVQGNSAFPPTPGNGAYMKISNDTLYFINTVDGIESGVNKGAVITPITWYHIRVRRVNGGMEYGLYLMDGTLIASHLINTNVPSDSVVCTGYINYATSLTSTLQISYLDYMDIMLPPAQRGLML